MLDPIPQTQEQQEAQKLYELASSLVVKVDALTRAALDLAKLRKEAKLKTITRTRNRLEEESGGQCAVSLSTFKRDTEKEIRGLQERVVAYEQELNDRHKERVERYENSWRAMQSQILHEHDVFVEKVTTNCAAYIERVMKLDKNQLVEALKDFESEISKWLLPEETECFVEKS